MRRVSRLLPRRTGGGWLCSATYPDIFSRAWADHETMLSALDDLTAAATCVRAWVEAKHHATSPDPAIHPTSLAHPARFLGSR